MVMDSVVIVEWRGVGGGGRGHRSIKDDGKN